MTNNPPEMTQAAAELQKVNTALTQRNREREELKKEKKRVPNAASQSEYHKAVAAALDVKSDKITARIKHLNELRAQCLVNYGNAVISNALGMPWNPDIGEDGVDDSL